jgi:GPI mannosyltransferase 2
MVRICSPEHIWMGPELLLVRCKAPAGLVGELTSNRNVGLFRYWTLSNLPLFLIATPALLLLITSSLWALNLPGVGLSEYKEMQTSEMFDTEGLRLLAIPQLTLALLALTGYHVQIINRLLSGYPLWCIWLASMLLGEYGGHSVLSKGRARAIIPGIKSMAVYALIQAGLFASFLPPA